MVTKHNGYAINAIVDSTSLSIIHVYPQNTTEMAQTRLTQSEYFSDFERQELKSSLYLT